MSERVSQSSEALDSKTPPAASRGQTSRHVRKWAEWMGFSPLVGSPIRMYMLVGGGGRGVPCP